MVATHHVCMGCTVMSMKLRRCEKCRKLYCPNGRCGPRDGSRCWNCPRWEDLRPEALPALEWVEQQALELLAQPRSLAGLCIELQHRVEQERAAPRALRLHPDLLLGFVSLVAAGLLDDGVLQLEGTGDGASALWALASLPQASAAPRRGAVA